MLRLLIVFTILTLARCSCPNGFELVGSGQCRELTPYATLTLSYNTAVKTAISKCAEIQAQPVIIHTVEEHTYWKAHQNEYIILGLLCNSTSKKWQWSDGSYVDYTPPPGGDDLTGECKPDCSWFMYTIDNSGDWITWCGSNTFRFDIFCTKQLEAPEFHPEGCYSFDDDNEDGVCYKIGATAESWSDAQLICKRLGANLASVHNANENAFIRRSAVANHAVHGVFLGATLSGKGNSYGWIDGSEWNYDNFYPGFPMADFGDCIALDTSVSSGQWMNVDCTTKLPVACIRELNTVQEWPVACDVKTYKQEGKLITSPGFPFNASLSCDYYLEVDAGKKVEVEITLEANSCCDFLVLYEGYFGGYVLANLTGEIQKKTYTTADSNIMRVSWVPNGGVNVRGMAMTFRGV